MIPNERSNNIYFLLDGQVVMQPKLNEILEFCQSM